jgi:hypothetical protein
MFLEHTASNKNQHKQAIATESTTSTTGRWSNISSNTEEVYKYFTLTEIKQYMPMTFIFTVLGPIYILHSLFPSSN